MKKIRLTLLSLSSFILLFLTACQKDDMDKGGSGTGVQEDKAINKKNAVLTEDSIEFDQKTNSINE